MGYVVHMATSLLTYLHAKPEFCMCKYWEKELPFNVKQEIFSLRLKGFIVAVSTTRVKLAISKVLDREKFRSFKTNEIVHYFVLKG